MFAESKAVDFVAIAAVVVVGSVLHYRIRRRRLETRLAVGILEANDTLLVDALDRLSGDGEITRLQKRTYSVSKRPSELPVL